MWKRLTKGRKVPGNLCSEPGFGNVAAYKEMQYEKLARILRDNLDMELIYGILNRER